MDKSRLPRKREPLGDLARKRSRSKVSAQEPTDSSLKRTKSWRERHAEMPSPPPELPKDTTELSLSFEVPTPESDRGRVLASGGTETLTVNDVASREKDRSKYALNEFVKSQFPALEKIWVLFRLQRTSSIHTDVKNDIGLIAEQFVNLSKDLNPKSYELLIAADCMWIDNTQKHFSIAFDVTEAIEKNNIMKIFNDRADDVGLEKPFTVVD